MFWPTLLAMLALMSLLLLLESKGVPLVLQLSFKGDIKRESQFLAQYGQSVASPLTVLLVWQLDPNSKHALAAAVSVCTASAGCFVLKRLFGRVRPNRPDAGKFLGPSFKHQNWRESFPSSHSACALAISVPLAYFYPPAAWTFLGLAFVTALLRWILDAHWPSDIWAGLALGFICGVVTLHAFGLAVR